jgi:LacI family transcriptional regulator
VLARLSLAGLPTVALLTRQVPSGVGYVTVDNLAAMHEVVAHLRVAGHERIAYIGPASDADFRDRIDGYRQGLSAVGLPSDPALEVVLSMDRDFWAEAAYRRALDCWQALPEPPTAIIVPDDEMAARVIDLLRDRGLRVPDDIAVTGFNDIAEARYIGGGLTTIRQPLRRIGERATEQLIALIGGAPVEECRITLPGTLIPRATTERPVSPSTCLSP